MSFLRLKENRAVRGGAFCVSNLFFQERKTDIIANFFVMCHKYENVKTSLRKLETLYFIYEGDKSVF